jgi:hypothetical protein
MLSEIKKAGVKPCFFNFRRYIFFSKNIILKISPRKLVEMTNDDAI